VRAFLLGVTLLANAVTISLTPARLQTPVLPDIPIAAMGGGEVFVEAIVSDTGSVSDVRLLRATPPFEAGVVSAVRGWRFTPAEEETAETPGAPRERNRLRSSVLVAAVFRPPTLNTPTFGESPKDVAAPSPDVAFPASTIQPPYPPTALASGVVLVEVALAPDGRITGTRVVRSAPPFDGAAVDAAKQFTFRPGRLHGAAAPQFAYIIFGFRQPVTLPTAVSPR